MIPDDYADVVALMVDANSGTVIDNRLPRPSYKPPYRRKRP